MDEETQKKTGVTPLILEQSPRNIKGTRPLPYEFESETYEVYRNPKNPFLKRILSRGAPPLDEEKGNASSLFQEMESFEEYGPNLPGRSSPHRKRKVASGPKGSKKNAAYDSELFLPEDRSRLQLGIEAFFMHTLSTLKEDSNLLPKLVNDLIPLFLRHEVFVRVFPAYRQFQSFEQFLDTLEQISEDVEIENFELFCSALFGYYSQMG